MKIEWNIPKEALSEKLFGHSTQLFAANEAKRIMEPYVPADTFSLAIKSVEVSADNNKGKVAYNAPYAHYIYEGIKYVDPVTGKGAFYSESYGFWSRPGVPKVSSGEPLRFSTSRHPLATAHWDKAAFAARGADFTKAVQAYVRSKV